MPTDPTPQRALALLGAVLAASAFLALPTVAAHECDGPRCGDCDGPGDHRHTYVEKSPDGRTTHREFCTRSDTFLNVPGPGAATTLAALFGAALLALLSPGSFHRRL